MKIFKIVGTLVIASLFIAPGVMEAGKPINTAEREVVGQGRDLEIVPDLDRAVPVGATKIWAEDIHIDGAFFLKPHFAAVNLRAGDAIVVRSATGRAVETITGRGPKDMGSFWGLSAQGEDLFLEFQFSHDYLVSPFRIDKVVVGDIDPFASGGNPENVCGSPDFEDVVCYQGESSKWANVMASVGVMNVGSTPTVGLWCSGSNVSSSNYVLTNDHCIPSQSACDTAEYVFRYYNESCGGGPTTNDWVSFRCDDVMVSSPWDACEATASTLDFAITSVIGDPASTFGFVEVDPDPIIDGEAVYMVQHPLGRPHEITHGSGADVDADAPNLRYYNTLDSDGGSSGSPIFSQADHRLVGLHHCGGCETPGEGNRGMMMSEIYPLIEEYVCAGFLDVDAAGTQGLVEVSGNGNATLEPGETWQFEPLVRNLACVDDAFGVIGDIVLNAGSNGPVSITNGAASFGDVLARETLPSQLPVIFEVDMGAVCGEDVVFDLVNLTANNGGPFPSTEEILSVTVGELMLDSVILEDLAGGIPVDWTVVHNGTATGPAATWTIDNPGGVSLPLTEPFAIVDSDEAGSGVTHDEELITAQMNCSGYDTVELRFNHVFRWWSSGGNEQGDVDVRSTATGGAWVNVANFSGGDHSGNVAIDISDFAVGQSDVDVRFHYYDAAFDYWWAVDDIEIIGGVYICGTTVVPPLFADDFESGDTTAWAATSP